MPGAFERLERLEGAQVDHCYDDQYIASGGQLALLALGHYAMAADLAAVGGGLERAKSQCAKAYDIAGAVLVAREAGCEVLSPDGSQLDFALDGEGPVGFVAYPGLRSRERLHPHFGAMLAESGVSRRPFLAT
ncbi:MAG: hypothetical protein R3E96_00670 [Planctomycetota bacterium]